MDKYQKPDIECLAIIGKKFSPIFIQNFSNLSNLEMESLIFVSLDGVEQKSKVNILASNSFSNH